MPYLRARGTPNGTFQILVAVSVVHSVLPLHGGLASFLSKGEGDGRAPKSRDTSVLRCLQSTGAGLGSMARARFLPLVLDGLESSSCPSQCGVA